MRFLTCGVDGILVELADLNETLRVFAALRQAVEHAVKHAGGVVGESAAETAFAGVKQLIPAARTIYVSFDPLRVSRSGMVSAIRSLNIADNVDRSSRIVEIPVIYDGEDLTDVADLLGVSVDEVVRRHCGSDWSVAFVGFAPGFAYLTGGDPIFDVPRRKVPRLSVPAGAVGLAGTFSGVYPRVSSGGWQLLGHTEVRMWSERADPPALLQPGDTVRFTPARNAAIAVSAGIIAPTVSDSPESDTQTSVSASHVSVSGESDVQTGPDKPHMSVSPESDTYGMGIMDQGSRSAPRPPASALAGSFEVLRPGLLTTFQDDGRAAANMGVTGSGAADRESFHLANALVGNPANTPALEITGGGVKLRAHGSLVVAVTGAPADIAITGVRQSQENKEENKEKPDRTAIAMQEAMLLRDGDTLSIGPPSSGLRDYLSVRGGFDVEVSLDSASTDTMSGIGPRPIAAKQRLAVRFASMACDCGVDRPRPWPTDLPRPGSVTDLYVRLGPRDDWFTADGLSAFLERTWTVTAQSNRVGLRLSGDVPLERVDDRELPSEATPPGAVEVPTSGQPVIFLRDQPVTGGYPVIAVLEPGSLDMAGQLPPGAQVRFRIVPERSLHPAYPAYPSYSAHSTKEVR